MNSHELYEITCHKEVYSIIKYVYDDDSDCDCDAMNENENEKKNKTSNKLINSL